MSDASPSEDTAFGDAPPRFDRFELPGSSRIALSVLPTKKLKTVLAKIYLLGELDEATVTQRSLLPSVLRRGTRELSTMQAINRHLEWLYGASFWSNVVKIGEQHITVFQIEVVNDRFLPEKADLFSQALSFLRDLLLDPHLIGGAFASDAVEQEKETLQRGIEGLIEEKSSYAAFRCAESMFPDEPYRLYEHGRVEDLPSIDGSTLQKSWQSWVSDWPMSIYVAGDVEPERIRDQVSSVFQVADRNPIAVPATVVAGDAPSEPRQASEHLDVQQSKLVLGFRHGVTFGHEDHEALILMNAILGGMSTSKLFQNVREKASLAYSASSWSDRAKGLGFIACGIAPENRERAIDICLEQIEALKRGEISDEEDLAARSTTINGNVMLEDNLSGLAAADYMRSLFGMELDLNAFRQKISTVPRERLVAVAHRMKLDTVFYLGPKES